MAGSMKDIRIFVASSKELERERNYLAYLVLSKEEEFAKRGLRVRLAKWEYVDPRLTEARTEDRYLDEMYDCDAAFVLFRDIAGMYTREELDKALVGEREGWSRLKAHRILFAADGAPDSDAAKLRAELPEGSYGVWIGMEELRAAFLELVDRVAEMELREAPSDQNVRKITAFLAADEELAEERNAFADTVLNVNDLLEPAHRSIRVQLKFYNPANAESVIESSEMGLVLYGTNYRVFGRKELERIYARVKDGQGNPKRFYVFFRDLDEATEKSLDETFKAFRSDFVTKLGHFTCQFGDANALRLGFLLSLERYAGETIEIYSTVGTPTAPVFVGRENELRELCRLLEPVPGQFPAGRLPVITGAGGTGKSELVRQFAAQLRVQYPGGVFQVDMEHVKTWDEAFRGLLAGVSNNGVKVRDYLGLEQDKDGKERDGGKEGGGCERSGAKVRDALLEKARGAGPMLLFLDNVESFEQLLGEGDAFSKAFPVGFSERVRVDVVATARACDVVLGSSDWAIPFPLGDLTPEAALDLLLKNKPADGEQEIAAAKRITKLLGCRALYLRRVPAILKRSNKKAKIVCHSYAALAELLEKDSLLTINRTATVEADYLPGRLWELVRNNLAKWGLGEACITLIHIASFFSPDGFPRHILRHLWNELVFPGLEEWGIREEVFDEVFDLAKQYNIFQSADPVRIHRLDRAAILQTAKCEPGLEEAIGKSLAAYEGMSPDNWLLLAEHVGILRFIPDAVLSKREIVGNSLQTKLLCLNPAFQSLCLWNSLNGRDWALLLGRQPRFAEKCQWNKLNGWDWAFLLARQPQFAGECSWEKLNGWNWACLLGRQPQFTEKCPWNTLGGRDWAGLLGLQPQFADKCPWNDLSGNDWALLLGKQPRFADRCTWKKFDGDAWARLLCTQPQFAGTRPWNQLNASAWALLLGKQPQFADKCPWNDLSGNDWALLLGKQPRFADRCTWKKFDGDAWARLLCTQPQFAGTCPWNQLNARAWALLLGKQPQFADKCPWDKLDGSSWVLLLCKQPQFADKCPWKTLTGRDWIDLLIPQPQFADKYDWSQMSGNDFSRLISFQPQLVAHCDLQKLQDDAVVELLAHYPQYANRCDWQKLKGEKLGSLIALQPHFFEKCNLSNLDGIAWAKLLSSCPQFSGQCEWDKLDGRAWLCLLAKQPQFSEKCDWSKLNQTGKSSTLLRRVSGHLWATLLSLQPQFADKCDWKMLGALDWASLLSCQPQFAAKCEWREFNGGGWAIFLSRCPGYATHCDWSKLNGGAWARLLSCQPQFADRCAWERLSDEDWSELLRAQPQFADKR